MSIKVLERYVVLNQLILYGIIGALSASLDSILFFYLIRYIDYIYVVNFISINAGILLSFFLNSFFNFKKTDKFLKRAASFFSVGYVGLLLSTIILYIGIDKFHYSEIFIKIVSIFIVAAFQFVLNKLITFGKRL